MSSLVLCEKRKALLAQSGHTLVTGGPGCGKTTIALLKARERSRTLQPGQAILFLSFSRAAIQQILTRSADLLTSVERKLVQVQTYHSFCIEALQSHGHLVTGRPCRFLFPGEERLQKSTFGDRWEGERSRRATEESVFCFDLVARGAANLFICCKSVRRLYADKFPLVIVDEFQDTDDDQWDMVKALAGETDVMCLADVDQRIFDYRPGVDPRRVGQVREILTPAVFDLGCENHRSPTAGIVSFADAVLHNSAAVDGTSDVRSMTYRGRDFDACVHASVVWTFSELNRRKADRPTVAVLCRSNALVARVSVILSQPHSFRKQRLHPINHSVLWDAELSAAAALAVGAMMDCSGDARHTVISTLRFIARYYHIKNAEDLSASAVRNATAFGRASERLASRMPPRLDAEKKLVSAFQDGIQFVGDPIRDWLRVRELLKMATSLQPLFSDASLVRLFGARDALASGLGERWLSTGTYAGAAELVRRVLDRERLIASERAPSACSVMNMHKAKGKEFDGIVLVEGAYTGAFFPKQEDRLTGSSSRRLLRVALTRARSIVTLVRPQSAPPLII